MKPGYLTSAIFKFFLILSVSFGLSSPALGLGKIEISGSMSRDITSGGYLDLTIKVTSVASTEKVINAEDEPNGLVDKLEIFLDISDKNNPIELGDEKTTERNNKFYWNPADTVVDEETNTDGTTDIIYLVRIFETADYRKQAFADEIQTSSLKKTLVGHVTYDPNVDGIDSKSGDFTVEQSFSVPNEAPDAFLPVPSHKSISFDWTKETEIDFKLDEDTNESKTAPGILAFVFENATSEISLDDAGFVASLSESDDEPASGCTFTPPSADGESCIKCDNDDTLTYFKADLLKEIDEAKLTQEINNTGKATIKNLDPDSSYTIALSYIDGVKRSECYTLSPIINVSMLEFNGEDEGKPEDLRCFIATAAYGSPFEKHVADFRWFRDEVLLAIPFGKDLVDFYYKISPPLAEIISDSESLRSTTRGLLYIPALSVHTIRHNTGIFALLLLLLIGLVVISYDPRNKGH